MIQLELALVYFATFCWKLQGPMWLQGTALYYVYHLDEIRRFHVPAFFMQPIFLGSASWFALALEFSLGNSDLGEEVPVHAAGDRRAVSSVHRILAELSAIPVGHFFGLRVVH